MEDQIVKHPTALLAKSKGFTTPSTSYSDKYFNEHGELKEVSYKAKIEKWETQAPTQSLLQKGLREVHNVDVEVNHAKGIDEDKIYLYSIDGIQYNSECKTYEDALEKGLFLALRKIQ